MYEYLKILIFISGIGHIVLAASSLVIPKLLNWKKELNDLQPLLRQMFWTYAAYILVINFCFGIVSVFGVSELLNKSFLAKSVTLFISVYWWARVFIQFFYFDKSQAPKGILFSIGEYALIASFVFFAGVYLAAFYYNIL